MFLRAALAGWLLLVAISSDAAPAVKQVLVLQSFDRGAIEAHNNPEGGATFTMTLRRCEAPESLSVPGAA